MAKYTELQLNTLYSYLGYNFYIDFEAEISSAIQATQSEADGGTRPDNSLQLQILAICNTLTTVIDAGLANLAVIDFVVESSKGSTRSDLPTKVAKCSRKTTRVFEQAETCPSTNVCQVLLSWTLQCPTNGYAHYELSSQDANIVSFNQIKQGANRCWEALAGRGSGSNC